MLPVTGESPWGGGGAASRARRSAGAGLRGAAAPHGGSQAEAARMSRQSQLREQSSRGVNLAGGGCVGWPRGPRVEL